MADRGPVGVWESRILRWGAPVTFVGAVALISLTLVSILVRSPETKLNYQTEPAGYHRTPLASMAAEDMYRGLRDDLAGADGRALYVGAGCALCHGLHGAGGPVAPPIWSKDAKKLTTAIRQGDSESVLAGMPPLNADRLSDEQITKIAAYLLEMKKANPDEVEVKPAKPPKEGLR